MTLFILSNYLFLIYTASLFYNSLAQKKYLFIKPSFWFLLSYFIIFIIPSTFYSHISYNTFKNPWALFSFTHLLPLVSLSLSLKFFNKDCQDIWNKLHFNFNLKYFFVYFGMVLIAFIIYFTTIDITETGLYGIIFEPKNSAIMREKSLKLIDSSFIKYCYSLTRSSIIPVLWSLLALHIVKEKKYIYLPIMGFLFIFSFLPGDRWTPLLLIFTLFLTFQYSQKFSFFTLRKFILILLLMTNVIAFISIKREGWDIVAIISEEGFLNFLIKTGNLYRLVIARALVTPMKVGFAYFKFSEIYGFWGVHGIPKLASLLGQEAVSLPNYMYHYMFPNSLIPSGTYPACFIFSYYSCFSLWAFPLSLLLILLLDGSVFLYKRINPTLLIPVMASEIPALINLLSAEYTTCLLTHGVLAMPVIAVIISKCLNDKFVRKINNA